MLDTLVFIKLRLLIRSEIIRTTPLKQRLQTCLHLCGWPKSRQGLKMMGYSQGNRRCSDRYAQAQLAVVS